MVPGPRERRPKSSGSPIAYQVDRVEHLSPDKLFLGFWDFFSMSQNGPTRPRNMSWDPTGYLDPREVHREQVLFLGVDRTWVHLPGSQGRGPGYGRENFRGFFFFILSTWTNITVRYSVILYIIVRYSVIIYITVRYSVILYITLRYSIILYIL